jgi:hypothetical protein
MFLKMIVILRSFWTTGKHGKREIPENGEEWNEVFFESSNREQFFSLEAKIENLLFKGSEERRKLKTAFL